MKCPHCGFENVDTSKHCLNCGARMDGNILCPKCGEAISPDFERCPHCNHKIPHIVEEEISPEEYSRKSIRLRMEVYILKRLCTMVQVNCLKM